MTGKGTAVSVFFSVSKAGRDAAKVQQLAHSQPTPTLFDVIRKGPSLSSLPKGRSKTARCRKIAPPPLYQSLPTCLSLRAPGGRLARAPPLPPVLPAPASMTPSRRSRRPRPPSPSPTHTSTSITIDRHGHTDGQSIILSPSLALKHEGVKLFSHL